MVAVLGVELHWVNIIRVALWKACRSWATETIGEDKIVSSKTQSYEQVWDIHLVSGRNYGCNDEWMMRWQWQSRQRYDGDSLWKAFCEYRIGEGQDWKPGSITDMAQVPNSLMNAWVEHMEEGMISRREKMMWLHKARIAGKE